MVGVRTLLACFCVSISLPLGGLLTTPVAAAGRHVSAAAEIPQACEHTVIVGVRGSGETRADDGESGFGKQVGPTVRLLMRRLHDRGRTTAEFPLQYTAADVDLLMPNKVPEIYRPYWIATYRNRVREFMASIADGVASLHTTLMLRQQDCPHERIVLVGYSQGSMVVRRTLSRLSRQGETELLSRVSAVGLIADGHRRSREPNSGTADASAQGIATYFGLAGPPLPMPPAVRGKVVQLCNAHDVVCNFALSVRTLSNGKRVHLRYARSATFRRFVADLVQQSAPTKMRSHHSAGAVASPPDPYPYDYSLSVPALVTAPSLSAQAWDRRTARIIARKRALLVDWIDTYCRTDPAPQCAEPSYLESRWTGRIVGNRYASAVMASDYKAGVANVNQNDADSITMSLSGAAPRAIPLREVLHLRVISRALAAKIRRQGVAPGGLPPWSTQNRCEATGFHPIHWVKDYTINGRGVTFWFDRYQAASGACSQTAVMMSWRRVAPALTATGRSMRRAAS